MNGAPFTWIHGEDSPARAVRRFRVDSRSSGEEFTVLQGSPRQSSHTATTPNVSRAHQTLDQGPSGVEHQCRRRRRCHSSNHSPGIPLARNLVGNGLNRKPRRRIGGTQGGARGVVGLVLWTGGHAAAAGEKIGGARADCGRGSCASASRKETVLPDV
jgi:hypothetical protein